MLSSLKGDALTSRVCLVAVKCCVSQFIIAANEACSHGSTVVVNNFSFLLRQTGNKIRNSKVPLSTIGCDSGALPPFNFLNHSSSDQSHKRHYCSAWHTFLLFQGRYTPQIFSHCSYILLTVCNFR
jgi:hypothetical protein